MNDAFTAGMTPERRSLVALSLAAILFFFAGGQLDGEKLSLPMMNVSIERVWVITAAFWAAWAWSYFRFWQAHSKDVLDSLMDVSQNGAFASFAFKNSLKIRLAQCEKATSYSRVKPTGLFTWIISPHPIPGSILIASKDIVLNARLYKYAFLHSSKVAMAVSTFAIRWSATFIGYVYLLRAIRVVMAH